MAHKVALITGVTGQDGSYLAEFLLNKGYTVPRGQTSWSGRSIYLGDWNAQTGISLL